MQTIAHRTRRPTWHSHPASPEQVNSIARNRGRKILDSGLTDLLAAWDYAVEQGTPSKGEASTILDALFAAPWLPRTPVVDHAGSTLKLQARQVYRAADGRVIRIQKSRETGSLYGKALDQETGAWDYLPGVQGHLSGARLLTLDEAIAISAAIGQCVRCSRTLTAAESIERGIGPICAQAFS